MYLTKLANLALTDRRCMTLYREQQPAVNWTLLYITQRNVEIDIFLPAYVE